jgi:hypothetical protein
MTSDPVRLLRGADVGEEAELERELLRSIADVSPPPSAEAQAWDGIASRIAAASAIAAGASVVARAGGSAAAPGAAVVATKTAAPAAAAGIAHAFATKTVVGAVLATLAAGGAWTTYSRWTARPKPAVVVPADPAHGAVAPVAPPAEPAPETPARNDELAPPPAASKPTASAVSRARSDDALALAEESALLTEARASLKRGDPAGALATLRSLDARSPHGVLHQEREVLAIQALAASGEQSAARRRALAFVKAYPNSPHTPLLRRLMSEP